LKALTRMRFGLQSVDIVSSSEDILLEEIDVPKGDGAGYIE
jgi:hypothetical protein